MFIIRREKAEDLKQGRTITYLAKQLSIPRPTLTNIMNGRVTIREEVAEKILKKCFENVTIPELTEYFKEI